MRYWLALFGYFIAAAIVVSALALAGHEKVAAVSFISLVGVGAFFLHRARKTSPIESVERRAADQSLCGWFLLVIALADLSLRVFGAHAHPMKFSMRYGIDFAVELLLAWYFFTRRRRKTPGLNVTSDED